MFWPRLMFAFAICAFATHVFADENGFEPAASPRPPYPRKLSSPPYVYMPDDYGYFYKSPPPPPYHLESPPPPSPYPPPPYNTYKSPSPPPYNNNNNDNMVMVRVVVESQSGMGEEVTVICSNLVVVDTLMVVLVTCKRTVEAGIHKDKESEVMVKVVVKSDHKHNHLP
nr:hypothetical protein [Tanacetum cinerariifolium]